ncbi:unnamed protein product [Lepeophtheirus salmonis]|uniref:(salmon louse) hypothetical protein n=1 Tax=Lepeophtheirus salmonis TaxID=72036 RepID=A0A817FB35_LEPSM|nr:unnamed protein product [Lepeophtheirus salmonis]CAG9476899.1 unnamed protein product [Lepeophtheirus salmonis]
MTVNVEENCHHFCPNGLFVADDLGNNVSLAARDDNDITTKSVDKEHGNGRQLNKYLLQRRLKYAAPRCRFLVRDRPVDSYESMMSNEEKTVMLCVKKRSRGAQEI